VSRGTPEPARCVTFSSTGLLPSVAVLSNAFRLTFHNPHRRPIPLSSKDKRFGLFPFRSPLLRKSNFFLFLRLLRCFSSPGSLLTPYIFKGGYQSIKTGGFPHSEIDGSKLICSSPSLIAACHVLLRLLMPRHPLYALISLIILRSFLFAIFGKTYSFFVS
jgi:hypothetical protein